MCMINMTLMEAISEVPVRAVSAVITIGSGLGTCGLLMIYADINSGTPMTILTHVLAPTGLISFSFQSAFTIT